MRVSFHLKVKALSSSDPIHAVRNLNSFSLHWICDGTVQQENLQTLNDKMSRKIPNAKGQRVGPGWLKYQHGDAYWNLDDGTFLVTHESSSSVTCHSLIQHYIYT